MGLFPRNHAEAVVLSICVTCRQCYVRSSNSRFCATVLTRGASQPSPYCALRQACGHVPPLLLHPPSARI